MSNLPALVSCAAESIIKQVPIFAVCSDTFKAYQEKKFEYFLDEVQRGTANLSNKSFNEYEILHAAYSTQLALLKIRQNEKIAILAQLFSSYFNKICKDNSKIEVYSDNYEQLLLIIEQVSLEEWQILLILYEWEQEKASHNTNIEINWNSFLEKVKYKIGLDKDYVLALLTRLNATGLCIKASMGVNFSGTLFIEKLTPIFYKLVEFMELK